MNQGTSAVPVPPDPQADSPGDAAEGKNREQVFAVAARLTRRASLRSARGPKGLKQPGGRGRPGRGRRGPGYLGYFDMGGQGSGPSVRFAGDGLGSAHCSPTTVAGTL